MAGIKFGRWAQNGQYKNISGFKFGGSVRDRHTQGSPQDKMKAQRMGVVWTEFVTTSIIWLPHQRNRTMEGIGGHYAERAWGEH